MLEIMRWYVAIQLVGIAALPIVARFFRWLPDHGYPFARPVGMLVVGVALWYGGLFGLWQNDGATVAFLAVGIGLAAWVAFGEARGDLIDLWKRQRRHIFVVEGVFLGAFLAWVVVRGFVPDIAGTEKPMDFAFLSGIVRSPQFPPVDPWLSGNSISYYYLGYLLIAALTELSGVARSVAFNLALALLFALTVTGAFAMGYYLVHGLRTQREPVGEADRSLGRSWLGGALAAIAVALMGNWEGFLEILHAHGFGSASFWNWVSIAGLSGTNPYFAKAWYPSDAENNWWWFRASRVITDFPFGGTVPKNYNTINEFPFFSYILGDMHPHVLALPFAFVCLAFALALLKSPVELSPTILRRRWLDGVFIAFLYGSLFLLNAWDMLTYLFVLGAAYAVHRFLFRPRLDSAWLKSVLGFGVLALIGGVVFYWPFYITFRSQASGMLGVVGLHSHLRQFLIFWGPFMFLAGSLIVGDLVLGFSPLAGRRTTRELIRDWTGNPLVWPIVAVIVAAAIVVHMPAYLLIVPGLVGSFVLIWRYVVGGQAMPAVSSDLAVSPRARGRVLASVASDGGSAEIAGGATAGSWAAEHVFVLIMLFTAFLLLFGTELVYIKDVFNSRMNTVFKLYYQAWQMLALAGAYTVYYLAIQRPADARSREGRGDVDGGSSPTAVFRYVWLGVVVVFAGAALIYAPAAVMSRTNAFGNPFTLDGLAYYAHFQKDDAAGIDWLNKHAVGDPVLVEATGGSYSQFGEVAWMTGLPTILGWDGHEAQWRGASIASEVGHRREDINTIYKSTDIAVVQGLLKKYHVTYVYVGPMEREAYPNDAAGLSKFGRFMDVVYKNPGVTIYAVRGGGS